MGREGVAVIRLRSIRPPRLPGSGRVADLRIEALPRPVSLPHLPLRQLIARLRAMSLRRKLICIIAVAVFAIGGWLVLRDSPLFSVDQVEISGLPATVLPQVGADLRAAARRQTTTDFSVGALRAAVAHYSVITQITATTHFPHGVSISVDTRTPVARLDLDHHLVMVDATGALVTGVHLQHLVVLRTDTRLVRGATRDPFVLVALQIVADAPAALRSRVASVSSVKGLLTVHLRRGPRLIFGNDALPHAKWDSAAAVLADASSRGAAYIDVEVPSRPAAMVADSATSPATDPSSGGLLNAPSSASSVSTLLNPALITPSSYTSG
jgi:cell division septal protein FtsQ